MPKTTQNKSRAKHCRNVTMMEVPKGRNFRVSMDFDNDFLNRFQIKDLKGKRGRNMKPKTTIMFKDITIE